MKKIPTLFERDPDDRKHVLPIVTPGCEWVMEGEGVATRKYDGTCVMFDGENWWARREVKPGKNPPENFVQIQHDDTTGKTMGWEPIDQSGFYKFFTEAVERHGEWRVGTYELWPKIQGNPEDMTSHHLMSHATADRWPALNHPESYEQIKLTVLDPCFHLEGIVWHHPDGRMAKIKVRDFS